ncbi:lipoyl(octanoyl) transferase LipB [Granulicoccus sp. GXG6511]|uniref:lipoyl(octanoyl) transferase LipB n=1 Tax=Granulicoccus sp. GXG6511 TaxID=3381351 RepID=UPI003D7DCA5F
MSRHYRWLGLVDYQETWDLQRELHARVVEGGDETVLMLEHHAVYTAGRRTLPEHRPIDGTPVIDVDRGGLITWHGPGQLVGYPIVRLPDSVGVVDYIRRVEEAVIRYLAELGLVTGRVRGRAGVWLAAATDKPERKIAQIGVRVAHKAAMHGFSLNVAPDMSWTQTIVPCGITDAGVTSLALELSDPPTVREAADGMERHLEAMLAWGPFEQSPDVEPTAPEPTAVPQGVSYGLTV